MASGRQWHLKHERQAREAAAGVSCGPGQARWTSMHGRQTTRDDGVLIVRKLIAWVFLYSLDGWHNAYGRDDVDEAFTFLERSFSDCTSFMFELQAYDVVGDMAVLLA